MNGKGKRSSWQTARFLLSASQLKDASRGSLGLVLPSIVGLANLLFCVSFENPIKQNHGGRPLFLFLFIQGWVLFFLGLTHLSTHGAELLRKTLVMPTKPSARITFSFLAVVRNPSSMAIVLTDVLFLFVLYHQSLAALVMMPALIALMASNVIALAAVATGTAIRRSHPPTVAAAFSVLGLIGIMVFSLLLHMPAAFSVLPPMSWTAQGILAIVSGEFLVAFAYAGASGLLLVVVFLLGRRLV